jgi:hypothetical protein
MLDREKMLAWRPGKPETVPVPEIAEGENVFVRGISARERDEWEMGNYDLRGKESKVTMRNARARFAELCVCDEKGIRLFQPGDAEQLGNLPAAALDRIYDVGRRLSGMTVEAAEDLRKNSASTQPNGSHTVLHPSPVG